MKKIVSIIIAITLILGLCPQIFAADTGDAFDGYEYVFTAEAQGKSDTVSSGFSDTYDNIDEDISDEWAKPARYYVIKDYLYPKKNVAEKGGLAFPFGTERLATGEFWAGVKINVENAGTYKPELKYFASKAAPIVDVYLIKAGTSSNGVSAEDALKASTNDGRVAVFDYLKALPDTYIVANDVNMWNDKKSENIYDFGGGVWTLEAGDYYLYFKSVGKDDNFEAADLKTEYGGAERTIAVLGLNSFSLTLVTEDEELTEAFTVAEIPADDYSEPTVISITKDGSEIKSKKNSDGTHNITAPEKNQAGAKFLYWAKGLSTQKRILIGETNVLTNYVPDSEYAEYLIPVYANEVSGNDEYYNANGQLIPGAKQETSVSMAGYGKSTGWQQYGDTNIWVATYQLAKPEAIIKITKKGEYNLNNEGNYAYGDTVTCTANDKDESGKPFKCWKKDDEIVGTDSTYSFKAWEDCTIEAVYETHVPYTGEKMKIIIDDFVVGSETGIMAEFIGLDSAVEKGIMFKATGETEATKIAMTTKDKQFTVIADGKGTYEGYAIVKEENGSYTLITDGKYE